MRTLLVLTEFSAASRNCGEMALYLASRLRVRLVLLHTWQEPIRVKVKDMSPFPLEWQYRMDHEPGYQLRQEVERLQQLEMGQGNFPPVSIETISYQGHFKDGLKLATDNGKILLAVAGDHTELDYFGQPDHLKKSEGMLSCPLLVIPSAYKPARDFSHIAFATDLAKKDLRALAWLKPLADALDCQLFAGHVSKRTFNMPAWEEMAAAIFMKGMKKLGIPLYTYQNYFSNSTTPAIVKFSQSKHASILAVVYKKHSKFWHWLHGSTSVQLLSGHCMPLLLIPEIS